MASLRNHNISFKSFKITLSFYLVQRILLISTSRWKDEWSWFLNYVFIIDNCWLHYIPIHQLDSTSNTWFILIKIFERIFCQQFFKLKCSFCTFLIKLIEWKFLIGNLEIILGLSRVSLERNRACFLLSNDKSDLMVL